MLVDEFYFHHKRGLGKWESWGHPIDSFLFLSCFLYAYFFSYSKENEMFFWILSILSCLIITKDEFIHAKQSSAPENYLHAFLFILHPLALLVLYRFWSLENSFFILIQILIITFFMLYQILYWNFLRKNPYAISN